MPIACQKCVPLPTSLGKRFSCEPNWSHAEEDKLLLLRAYYDELSDYAPWQAAVSGLVEQVRPIPLPPFQPMPDRARPFLERFAAEWHLPADRGIGDLWDSISLAESTHSQPRLLPCCASWSGYPKAVIEPVASEPFEYDLLWHSPRCARKHARELAKAVERQIVDQLRAVEAAAKATGFGERAPRYKNIAMVKKAAHRLFLYLIQDKTWGEVRDQTQGTVWDNKKLPARSGPVGQARRLATILNIPLPDRGR